MVPNSKATKIKSPTFPPTAPLPSRDGATACVPLQRWLLHIQSLPLPSYFYTNMSYSTLCTSLLPWPALNDVIQLPPWACPGWLPT